MLETALLMLTLTADGELRVTLSPAADAAECEIDRETVVGILTDAGQPPLVALCGQTALRLTPFVHGAGPAEETHRYRVELPSAGGYAITPLAEGEACTAREHAEPAIYCARSAQAVLPDG